jgi:hypothetical protein
MDIVSLIADIAATVTDTPVFLHGDKSFQNLQDNVVIDTGVIYLDEPITSTDTIRQSGYLEELYPLKILFAKKTAMDWTPAQHQVVIQACREMRREFLVLLQNNSSIQRIGSSRTTDITNLFDLNISGVYLEIEVIPFNEAANCFPPA